MGGGLWECFICFFLLLCVIFLIFVLTFAIVMDLFWILGILDFVGVWEGICIEWCCWRGSGFRFRFGVQERGEEIWDWSNEH